jgi:hypothetical protein
MASTRRAGTRKMNKKAGAWAMEVKKVYGELKKKMGKKATLKMAMKECSRRRKARK